MIDNPIFIVGTERSGSNLLRVMLNELAGVCVPHPPHLMRDLWPLLERYGDLRSDKNLRRLVDHAVKLVELHFAPWPFKLDAQKIITDMQTRDLYSLYAAIYEQYREHSGKKRWACKSTFMIHHVQEILAHHHNPQFIHLVRDPRDVAVSAARSVFSHYHPYYVACLWSREQREGLKAARRLSHKTWLTLRYEDLIEEPKTQMRKVCAFLGEKYPPDLLKFFEKPTARALSKLSRSWENVGKPVLSDNKGRFTTHLSTREIALIESVCETEMLSFGYDLASEKRPAPNALQKAAFLAREKWLTFKQESEALVKDRNARTRFKKKAFLWSLRFR